MKLRTIVALALAMPATMVCTSTAAAADWYTLDGKKVASEPDNARGGCAAGAAADGEIACFSTEAKRERATLKALEGNTIPPGWGVRPAPDYTERAIQTAKAAVAAADGTKARRAAASRQNGCQRTATHVFTGIDGAGSYGYFGMQTTWTNHTATFNNTITSYRASSLYIPYWHDGPNGSGDYYNNANICRQVENLANGAWNDRFTSYWSY